MSRSCVPVRCSHVGSRWEHRPICLERDHRKTAADRPGLKGTDHPGRRAVRTVTRRADLGGLRARGDHRGARSGRSRGPPPGPPDHGGHRDPAGHPGLLLPSGDRCLSGRRWGLRGVPGQPRAHGQPGSRRGSHRRLHPDRRCLHRRRGGGTDFGVPGPEFGHSAALPRHPRRDHASQSAGAGRGRPGISSPDHAVHHRTAGHHRHRIDPPPGAACTATRSVTCCRPTDCKRSLCSWCSRRFPQGAARSPGWKPSPTASPCSKSPEPSGPNGPNCCSGVILGVMLLGLAVLAKRWHIGPRSNQTVLSQIMATAVGRHWAYYFVSLTITVVLALAANTSFGGLPILASCWRGTTTCPISSPCGTIDRSSATASGYLPACPPPC